MSSTRFTNLTYNSGFGNLFTSEALPGAVPENVHTRGCIGPYGTISELFNGTTFTAGDQKLYSWLYRTQNIFRFQDFKKVQWKHNVQGQFNDTNSEACPSIKMINPIEIPKDPTNFVQGLITIAGVGSPENLEGMAQHMYVCNKSMDKVSFVNADGDFLIVPEQGTLHVQTEMGLLTVTPKEIIVIPQGIHFSIYLPEGVSRGYVCEIFHNHFVIPPLGVLGRNALSNPRDFLAPQAYYEDVDEEWLVIRKHMGVLWECKFTSSPYNVVGWTGNYYPYKYDLRKYCPFGPTNNGHGDPSSLTILTALTPRPGIAVVDFILFCPRWLIGDEASFAPYPHRNSAYEMNGIIQGGDGKFFKPGLMTISPFLTPHGIREVSIENDLNRTSGPQRLPEDSWWCMFESGYMLRQTKFALSPENYDPNYTSAFSDIKKRFDPTNKNPHK